ncbi:hypothetical protein GCM10027569_87660 [Flindersiella endophytica]
MVRLDDITAMEHDYAVTGVHGFAEVVGDEQHRETAFVATHARVDAVMAVDGSSQTCSPEFPRGRLAGSGDRSRE